MVLGSLARKVLHEGRWVRALPYSHPEICPNFFRFSSFATSVRVFATSVARQQFDTMEDEKSNDSIVELMPEQQDHVHCACADPSHHHQHSHLHNHNHNHSHHAPSLLKQGSDILTQKIEAVAMEAERKASVRNVEGSFYRKPLPAHCIPFASKHGRKLFADALKEHGLKSYFALAEVE
jgi:hypothetical protein